MFTLEETTAGLAALFTLITLGLGAIAFIRTVLHMVGDAITGPKFNPVTGKVVKHKNGWGWCLLPMLAIVFLIFVNLGLI